MSAENSPIKPSRSPSVIETLEDYESQDTLIKHVDISIVESEKRANGTLHVRDHYTVYLIDLKVTDPDYKTLQSKISTIWRRYTEFEQIHDYLLVTYPHCVVPPLPEKRINHKNCKTCGKGQRHPRQDEKQRSGALPTFSQTVTSNFQALIASSQLKPESPTSQVLYAWRKSDTTDPEFVERRRAGLENFLLRVASHPRLSFDDQFISFLQQEHGWRETITDSGYLLQAENKLKSLSVSIRLKKPDPEIESVKNYGKQLETNLQNFLYTRSKIIEKNYAVCKLHASYGKLFSEWSVVEKEMGDGLQKAGHYFDSIAEGIDAVAEDEEQLADQLKEYLFYACALQHLAHNHEALQRNCELAHDTLANRIAERKRAAAGKSGIMSRLFGGTDPDIVRDHATRALDAKIEQDKENIEKAKRDLEEFSKKAAIEIEHFQKQKDKDLHESLVGFISLQVKAAKKNLQAWTQIKECLQNMP